MRMVQLTVRWFQNFLSFELNFGAQWHNVLSNVHEANVQRSRISQNNVQALKNYTLVICRYCYQYFRIIF
jgi:hypothetical protein